MERLDTIIDVHNTALNKDKIESLFWELNKELRKRFRRCPRSIKASLYVVGGANVAVTLQTRRSTTDIDAVWDAGQDMVDSICAVGDKFDLGHDWCNCDFKKTRSYTDQIYTNCKLHKCMDRLNVYMVNPDVILAMKLVSFRVRQDKNDMADCRAIIGLLRGNGIIHNKDDVVNIVVKYYGNVSMLSKEAKMFIGI